jgi:hypothetical protein
MAPPAELAHHGMDRLAVGASDEVSERLRSRRRIRVETGQACEWAVHNTAVLPSIHAQAGRSEGCATKVRRVPNRRSLNLNLRQLAAISGNLRHPSGFFPAPGRQSRREKFLLL